MDEEAENAMESLMTDNQPRPMSYQVTWTKVITASDQRAAIREARKVLRAPEGPDAVFDVREARKGAHGRPVTSSPTASERENEFLASQGVLNQILDAIAKVCESHPNELDRVLRLAWQRLTLEEHKAIYREMRKVQPVLNLAPLSGDEA